MHRTALDVAGTDAFAADSFFIAAAQFYVLKQCVLARSFDDGKRASGTMPYQRRLENKNSISSHSAGAFQQRFVGD